MSWWDAAEWEAMKALQGCVLCADAPLATNAHSDLVTETEWTYIRLHHNQSQPGYCVVIAKRHVTELHQMDAESLAGFWADVARVGRAVESLFEPVKIDSLVMGHRCPHVHCHVYPQYAWDDPLQIVDISAGTVRLTPSEQLGRLEQLAAALRG